MATPTQNMGGFYSTPGFKLYQRGLITNTVQQFHGINAYVPLNQLTGDWAQDCLNVIVGSSGLLGKMRLPVQVSAEKVDSFWDFQQGTGVRQVLAHNGQAIFYLDPTNNFTRTNIDTNLLNTGQWSFVEANNIMFGANGQRMMKWTGSKWQLWGIDKPAAQAQYVGSTGGTLSPATGFQYKYAYKNSVTGHVGNASDASITTGPGSNLAFKVAAVASPDPQVDTLVWFRTLDGGGDFYRLAEVTLANGQVTFNSNTVTASSAGNLQIVDQTPDDALDLTTIAPLINNVPPQAKYCAVGQGRIFLAGLTGGPSTVVYSGYEQILLGRPEESFPQYNNLLLNIGADSIVGLGVLQIGVLMFSQANRIYFLRGQVEDITLAQPINFSETLEELPWTMGLLSHETVQSTPYGIVWLAGDKTVQFWNGASGEPVDISQNVYPLLREITPGTESQCISAYFNWIERDWYVLTCCTNGSQYPNRIFFFALDSKSSNIEIFVSDVFAQWIGTIEDANHQRKLYVSSLTGGLSWLPVSATDIGGIVQNQFRTPATNGAMKAYWRSGYFGTDQPQRSKMWRYVTLICDTSPISYKAQHRITNDVVYTLAQPQIIGPVQFPGARIGINMRANRYSCELDFPDNDTDMNVLELQVSRIDTSDR